MLHELRDDVDWFLEGAHRVQLDQLRVPQLLHDGRLAQEVLRVHRAYTIKLIAIDFTVL